MKKAEIIAQALQKVRATDGDADLWSGPHATYAEYLARTLDQILACLPDEADILTCADFTEGEPACCPTCHDDYQDEMELVEIRRGIYAWICCAVKRRRGRRMAALAAEDMRLLRPPCRTKGK